MTSTAFASSIVRLEVTGVSVIILMVSEKLLLLSLAIVSLIVEVDEFLLLMVA